MDLFVASTKTLRMHYRDQAVNVFREIIPNDKESKICKRYL